jgi:hypothetical protein
MAVDKTPAPWEMIREIETLTIFDGQLRVNGWHKAYGPKAVKEVQAELDRRRKQSITGEKP